MHGVTNTLFEANLDQGWLEGRAGRAFGERGIVAGDAGVAHSPGRIDFTTVTVGLELRAFARSLVSPYARLEAGHLTEKIGDCFVAGWGSALAFGQRGVCPFAGGSWPTATVTTATGHWWPRPGSSSDGESSSRFKQIGLSTGRRRVWHRARLMGGPTWSW
jgi:hypothetical protein